MEDHIRKTSFTNNLYLKSSILTAFLILLSWLLPPLSHVWEQLDYNCALYFNHLFIQSTLWREFALFWNSRWGDWVYDLFMIGLFVYAYKKTRLYKKTTLLLTVILIVTIHITSFRVFSRRFVPVTMKYMRLSPSVSIPEYVRISAFKPNIKAKDSSDHCFPGDHALTCSLFVITMTIMYGARFGMYAFFLSWPIMFARAFVGAHWITDIFIGSSVMSLLYLSLLFYTPLFDTIVKKVEGTKRRLTHVKVRKDI